MGHNNNLDRLLAYLHSLPDDETYDTGTIAALNIVGRDRLQSFAKEGRLGDCVLRVPGGYGGANGYFIYGSPAGIARVREMLIEKGLL